MSTHQDSEDHGKSRAGLARLSEFSIRNPVSVCMILLSFLVLGGVSVTRIPLVLFPDLNQPEISVVVPYPNATPQQVQESIVKPLEEVLSTIPRITRMSSSSSASQGMIQMAFGWGEDYDYLRSEIRARVEQVRKDLPDDVDQIFVQNFSTSDIPIIEGRISSGRDLRGAYEFLDLKIKKPLERVNGVAEVNIGGVEKQQIEINLRLDDLKRYNVDVGGLFRRVDAANLNVSLGQVEDGGHRYGVRTDGAVASVDDLRSFPVNERGLVLSDVADVELADPLINYGRHLNGDYAISLDIRKASDANTVDVVDRIMTRIDELNEDPALEGIEVLVWHNAGKEIRKSLSGLLSAGLVGALLAIVVLFLFLRKLGPTLAIGFSIPFSIVAAIGFLYMLGESLNVLSMMGLMLSTGMLVDNAVVVIESIFRHLERGTDRVTAARQGTREVVTAVVASTLTSVIIFVPLVFGKKTDLSVFLGYTGTAIIITLFCSLFISLTLIPLGVAKIIRIDPNKRSPLRDRLVAWLKSVAPQRRSTEGGFMQRYMQLMGWTLRHRLVVSVVSIAIVAASFAVLGNLPDSSSEAEEMRDISIDYDFSENYHYAKIEVDYVGPVEQFLFANQDRFKISDIYSYYTNNAANTRLYFDTDAMTPGELTSIRKEISEELPVIPGAEITLARQDNRSGGTWLSVNLLGEDSVVLQALATEAQKRLAEKEGFDEIYTALEDGQEEVQLTLNREVARKYGISPESVAQTLGIVLRGQKLRGFRGPEGEVEIWVRLQPADRENLDDLKSMTVGNGSEGQPILLNQVAAFNIVRTAGSIQRDDRRTFTRLTTNYSGADREEAKEVLESVMNGLTYAEGYSWSYGFWTLREDAEEQDFTFNLLLALFMVYFVMASLFESLSHPFAIMISLVFAFVGVAWFLLITGTPFNIMAMIGSLILVGIVVNNGIVLIDHINNLRREGVERLEAVLQSCRERLRPILMTASTTIVGLVPLAIGTTSLFELRYFPMARTVMGGLMASTVLTLIVLPTVYTLVDDLSEGMRRIWRSSRPQVTTEAPAAETVTPG